MRIVLVVHGFPPHECTGVETHVAALARVLTGRGLEVEVFSTRKDPREREFALRREQREGFGVTWVIQNRIPQSARAHQERPGAVSAFGEFLERVRPDLVHFHHVHKLGLGVIDECVRRGLPSIYTLHDYFPVCHRVILSRPDLTRCETVGDARACARCDRAVGYLDGLGRWSDYQAGVLATDLNTDEQRALAACLQSDGEVAEREQLAQSRRQAFALPDLLLAPTDFMRERMIVGGLDPARIEVCEYGIETTALAAIAPPRDGSLEPLRFGYIGGAHKHKGLHVLLEAYARLRLPAQLEIHADSSDREYVAQLRSRAAQIGVQWHGAFPAEELAQVLAGIDVLIVPSTWWENAPFVIREAFAAARPVISSDLPALRESVQDGVDGLLVTPDDPVALAECMERLLASPELVGELSRNTRTPRSLDELCDDLIGRYQELIARRKRVLPGNMPLSARPFAERVLALERVGVDELAQRAMHSMEVLARSLGVGVQHAQPTDIELVAIERLRDARREIAWRVQGEAGALAHADQAQQRIEAMQVANRELTIGLERSQVELERRSSDVRTTRAALLATKLELERRDAQFDALKSSQQAAREALGKEQAAHAAIQGELKAAALALAQAARDLSSARLSAAQSHERATQLEVARVALEQRCLALEQQYLVLEQHSQAVERHAAWLELESAALARRFGPAPAAFRGIDDFRSAHTAFDQLEAELRWRRAQMQAVRRDGGRVLRALVERSALGRRLRSWGPDA